MRRLHVIGTVLSTFDPDYSQQCFRTEKELITQLSKCAGLGFSEKAYMHIVSNAAEFVDAERPP